MTATLALAIRNVMTSAPKTAAFIRAVTFSDDLQRQFDAADQRNTRDVGQVCMAVCRALIAHGFGTVPSDEQVAAFMEDAIGDPAFPARAYRLLGEMRKAASWRRRAFLASMLYGLSFDVLPDDERDRVDMAVERMMPADVDLLVVIAAKRGTRRDAPRTVFEGARVVALMSGSELRLATPDDRDAHNLKEEVLTDPRFLADRAAMASLVALGCLDLGESDSEWGAWHIHPLTVTPLGDMVIRAIEELRPGLATQPADGLDRTTAGDG